MTTLVIPFIFELPKVLSNCVDLILLFTFWFHNLLPEFRDWVEVGLGGIGIILVSDDGPVCGAVLRVPVVTALWPGQHVRERGEHVVEGPGQDDIVVAIEEKHDESRCYPDTCRRILRAYINIKS